MYPSLMRVYSLRDVCVCVWQIELNRLRLFTERSTRRTVVDINRYPSSSYLRFYLSEYTTARVFIAIHNHHKLLSTALYHHMLRPCDSPDRTSITAT